MAYTRECTQHMYLQYLPLYTFRPNASPKDKPKVVEDYNQHMLGVDKLDQLVRYYSFVRKSIKWWRKVFFWWLSSTHTSYRHGIMAHILSRTSSTVVS